MLDTSNYQHHVSVEALAEVLCVKTRKEDPAFFRNLALYYLGVMASSMRAKVRTQDRGEIPLNSYVVALAPSGYGKGVSTFTMEQEFMSDFRQLFRDVVMPAVAETNLTKLASRRAAVNSTNDAEELEQLEREYNACGEYLFSFDGGSEPAIKQLRQKLLLADCGSLNLQVDEIGQNLEKLAVAESLTVYLELYDQGMIKNKLTKTAADNKRGREIEGKTPANALLFGTGSALFDGATTEKRFMQLLDTGYARRSLFSVGDMTTAYDINMTAEEIYKKRVDPGNNQTIEDWSQHFAYLADRARMNWTIDVPDDTGIALTQYQIDCERRAREMPEHAEIQRTEMTHRYFKALKVAGIYAFVEESLVLTPAHLEAGIKLVEESGVAFTKMLRREAPYMKLARYITSRDTPVTQADLVEDLPFFKGSAKDRMDMITMATAWGYKQHMVIRKTFMDGIEFFDGETLEETSLDSVMLSYSDDFADGYEWVDVDFFDLHQLTQENGLHWCNHGFNNGHRADDDVIEGFNLVVIDVDGETRLETAHELLQDYVFMTYTTKRHTPDEHRFRIVIPTNYRLCLDKEDYREFMDQLVEWLPFEGIDPGVNQRSKKWMTCDKGTYHYNREGKLLDVLPFVPKTSKNEQHRKERAELGSLDSLEAWFAQRIAEGNRNNQMIKFALALVDTGMSYDQVEERVFAFNAKLSNGLAEDELRRTVLVTVAKKAQA